MAIYLLDGRVFDKDHPMTDEELEEMLKDIEDDPQGDETTVEIDYKSVNPLYARWAAKMMT